MASGLTATFIEAPEQIQKNMTIPQDHLDLCRKQGQPYTGNAAANSENYLDLAGQNLSKAALPAGLVAPSVIFVILFICCRIVVIRSRTNVDLFAPFRFTARGIVALVFSVLSAFLGMAVIVFYGSQELKKKRL